MGWERANICHSKLSTDSTRPKVIKSVVNSRKSLRHMCPLWKLKWLLQLLRRSAGLLKATVQYVALLSPVDSDVKGCGIRLILVKLIILHNSYTMGCPPVRGDNPRALASGLSYVQVDKHGITILYHLHQCRPCTSSDISC